MITFAFRGGGAAPFLFLRKAAAPPPSQNASDLYVFVLMSFVVLINPFWKKGWTLER